MPDLGRYAAAVILAYAGTGLLLAALVGVTLWQGARMRRRLAAAERPDG